MWVIFALVDADPDLDSQSGSEGYCENPMYWSPDSEYGLHHNVRE